MKSRKIRQLSELKSSSEKLDLKSILIQLSFGLIAGIALISVCGFAEWVHDLICR